MCRFEEALCPTAGVWESTKARTAGRLSGLGTTFTSAALGQPLSMTCHLGLIPNTLAAIAISPGKLIEV